MAETRTFLFSETLHDGSWTHTANSPMGIRVPFGGKAARPEIGHSPPLSTELRVSGVIPLNPLHAFMTWTREDLISIRNKKVKNDTVTMMETIGRKFIHNYFLYKIC